MPGELIPRPHHIDRFEVVDAELVDTVHHAACGDDHLIAAGVVEGCCCGDTHEIREYICCRCGHHHEPDRACLPAGPCGSHLCCMP